MVTPVVMMCLENVRKLLLFKGPSDSLEDPLKQLAC